MPRLSFSRNVAPAYATAQYSPSRANMKGCAAPRVARRGRGARRLGRGRCRRPRRARRAARRRAAPARSCPAPPPRCRAEAISARARRVAVRPARAARVRTRTRAREVAAGRPARRQRAIASSKCAPASSQRSRRRGQQAEHARPRSFPADVAQAQHHVAVAQRLDARGSTRAPARARRRARPLRRRRTARTGCRRRAETPRAAGRGTGAPRPRCSSRACVSADAHRLPGRRDVDHRRASAAPPGPSASMSSCRSAARSSPSRFVTHTRSAASCPAAAPGVARRLGQALGFGEAPLHRRAHRARACRPTTRTTAPAAPRQRVERRHARVARLQSRPGPGGETARRRWVRSRRSRSPAAVASCSTSRLSARVSRGSTMSISADDRDIERVQQRRVVAQPARDRDRLARHAHRLVAAGAGLHRRRQPGQQARAQRAVAGAAAPPAIPRASRPAPDRRRRTRTRRP